MRSFLILFALAICAISTAQEPSTDTIPYHKIPEAPKTFTAGTMVARMIDGLGFRYYWATEGLTDGNMSYKPSEKGRDITATVDHLYGLSKMILTSAEKKANDRTQEVKEELSFIEKRKQTLLNLEKASALYAVSKDLSEHKIIFKNANGSQEFPFWNQINGPIEDAVWHSGQIVVMRRSAGNPMNPKVNVFLGQLNE